MFYRKLLQGRQCRLKIINLSDDATPSPKSKENIQSSIELKSTDSSSNNYSLSNRQVQVQAIALVRAVVECRE